MPPTRQIIRFGTFELDLDSKELTKNGRRLRLQDQPFRLLVLLLERPGESVTRETLRQSLWPADTFVDFDHSLNAAVAKLRQALGDSAANPRFVETLAKRGYRFIAPVAPDWGTNPNGGASAATPSEPALPREIGELTHIARRRNRLLFLFAIVVAALTVAALLRQRSPVEKTELVKLTDGPGLSTDPAVSADGKLLAYASDRGGGNLNIWIQQLGSARAAIQLTHETVNADEPVFSPDGGTIAFHSRGGIFVVPAIGGEPSRLTASGRNPRFSPDGHFVAYWTGGRDSVAVVPPRGGPSSVYVTPVFGGEPKAVGTDIPAEMNPVWSEDGKHLMVYAPPVHGFRWDEADWWLVALDGSPSLRTGDFAALTREGFSFGFDRVPRLSEWAGDSVTFAAAYGDAMNTWRAPVSRDGRITGPARRLTSGTTAEILSASSPNGDLIFASLDRTASVWSLPADADRGVATGELTRITEGEAEFEPSVSADGGTFAYTAVRGRNRAPAGPAESRQSFPAHASGTFMEEPARLQTRIADRQAGKEVAIDGPEGPQWHPQISRDGAMIAYTLGKPGPVYTVAAKGGAPRLAIGGEQALVWDWSLDNRRILFNSFDRGVQRLHIADLDSGRHRLFLDKPGLSLYQAKFSPDDKAVAVLGCHDGCRIFVAPIEHGAAVSSERWIAIDHVSNWDDKPRWSPSGDLIYFISDRDGFLCLCAQRFDRRAGKTLGAPFPVYHLHSARLSMSNVDTGVIEIAVARDRVLLGLGGLTGNIWSLRRRS